MRRARSAIAGVVALVAVAAAVLLVIGGASTSDHGLALAVPGGMSGPRIQPVPLYDDLPDPPTLGRGGAFGPGVPSLPDGLPPMPGGPALPPRDPVPDSERGPCIRTTPTGPCIRPCRQLLAPRERETPGETCDRRPRAEGRRHFLTG